jgi:putative SOS response-associated peptidase YedK
MCARYTLEKVDDPHARFRAMGDLALNQRFNVAPSQYMPVVLDDGARRLDLFRWGLVPSWAKDLAIGNKMINARGETLGEKPSFRTALKQRRCLVPATGFYEWTGPKAARRPVRIHLKDDSVFAFAELWERWRDPASGKDMRTFTIITCAPNGAVAPIHDRMPVILRPDDEDAWLDTDAEDATDLLPLLAPYPADRMVVEPASRRVNSPANEGPELLRPD